MEYFLEKKSGKMQLIFPGAKINPLFVDFLSPTLRYRYAHGGGAQQLLAKAVGVKGQHYPYVLDATAGLGIDAVVLAKLGCKVLMLERSPTMYALLVDGLKRARLADAAFKALKLRLVHIDARVYLQKLIQAQSKSKINLPEVIYLDPMYPERKKAALNKKELRLLRAIVGEDVDAEELLVLARHCARKRVVVKRPRIAQTLYGLAPDLKFVGKSSRFDVYFTQGEVPAPNCVCREQ